MTATATATPQTNTTALSDLAIGDRVVLTRRDQTSRSITIIDRREVPAVAGWGGRDATILVRVPDGRWYDLADGHEHFGDDSHINLAPSH